MFWLKNLFRFFKFGFTLARHDALFPLEAIGLQKFSFVIKCAAFIFRSRKIANKTKGERLGLALQKMGPSFIKFGQALSTRADLIGQDIANDLGSLRDKLPPFDSKRAVKIIENELGQPLNSLYTKFNETPVAAASIAQVHKATTTEGKEVAVKVLRPNIEKQLKRDISFFFWCASMFRFLFPKKAKLLKPRRVVRIFEESIEMEVNLRLEAAAAGELADNFKGRKGFKVPEIDWQRTNNKVLTLEWIDGIKINEKEALIKAGHNLDVILQRSSESFFLQVFEDGFFHADIHPGNVFIDKNSNIVPIDFGIMGRVDEESRVFLAKILAGFLNRDYYQVAAAHFDAGYVKADKNFHHFMMATRATGEPIATLPIEKISIGRLLGNMFKTAERFEMETQPHLLLLQKTLVMSEGVGKYLNPKVNIWNLSEPLIKEWGEKNFSPEAEVKRRLKKLFKIAANFEEKLENKQSSS